MQTFAALLDVSALENETLYQTALCLCPQHRQRKAATFKNARDKRLSVGAWLVVKRVLSELGIDADHEEIAYGQYGKPYFAARKEVRFNLSHAGSMVLCAVSGRETGCDIEKIGKLTMKTAERCFHPSELACIRKTGESLLTGIWTLKESAVKCTGQGLACPFQSFSVCGEEDILPRITLDEKSYDLYELSSPASYRAALCLQAQGDAREEVLCRAFDLQELLNWAN